MCLPGKHPRKLTRSCFPSRPEYDGGHGAEREGGGGEGGRRRVREEESEGWLTGRLLGGGVFHPAEQSSDHSPDQGC